MRDAVIYLFGVMCGIIVASTFYDWKHKERLFFFVFTLLFALPCYGQDETQVAWGVSSISGVVGGGSTAAAPTCSLATVKDSCISNETNGLGIGTASTKVWYATRFVAGSSYSVCGIKATIARVGTDGTFATRTVKFCIFAATGGCTAPSCQPTTELGCSTNTLTVGDLSTSPTEYSFTGLDVSLTSGTNYWMAANVSAAGDASNYVKWYSEGTDCTTEDIHYADGTPTWTGELSDRSINFKTFTLE